MSELKRRHINEVMDMFCLTKGDMNWAYVYYADDADKVIAEKDKELRRQKYKRCLAIARWCKRRRIDAADYRIPRKKWEFYDKWHRLWLELAEKFKEAK